MNHDQFIFRAGAGTRLAGIDAGYTGDFRDEDEARAELREDAADLAKYQDILMAHETYGLLAIFQGMDSAGKDATIKHVMSNTDPQGCEVKMFKKPTDKELRHDYLWRAASAVPARGQIGIFNRSYYEQVVGERVHPENLEGQQLPPEAAGEKIWERRFRHVNNFEQYLFENGIHTLKFFLHLSKAEQRRRLLERIDREDKRWKFSESDIKERGRWDDYARAYEQAFENTSTEYAPWYVVPADNRWFARAAVASIIVAKLKSLHTEYPRPSGEQEKQLKEAREALEKEES